MIKKSIYCCLIVLLAACSGSKEEERPANILSPEKMVNLQIALHIAEAKAMQARIGADTAQALYAHYQTEIFAKNKIDTATYKRSFRYYTDRPAEFDKIYSQVVDSLGLRESQVKW